jgi:hypothetical protein
MQFGDSQTQLVYAGAQGVVQEQSLPMGLQQVGAGPFRTTPPTALALENAITSVEDVVMPMAKFLPANASLFASAEGVDVLFPHAAVELADIEDRFNALVAHVQGRPNSHQDRVVEPASAALLLMLREAMHHLGFVRVRFV